MSETPTPRPPKQPQDHKPKADAPFTFEGADGKTYTLPKITEDAAANVPFRFTRRLVMNPDDSMAQLAQAFALLDAVGADSTAVEALDDLPTAKAIEVTGDWMGESQRSAD